MSVKEAVRLESVMVLLTLTQDVLKEIMLEAEADPELLHIYTHCLKEIGNLQESTFNAIKTWCDSRLEWGDMVGLDCND